MDETMNDVPVEFTARRYGLLCWHGYWSDRAIGRGFRLRMFAGSARTCRGAIKTAEAAWRVRRSGS